MTALRILGDWGSTHLRLWLVGPHGPLDRRDGPGIVGLDVPPANALAAAIGDWLDLSQPPETATLVGMAGARGGLREVAYAPCPLTAQQWRGHAATMTLGCCRIVLGAGCASGTPDDPQGDVMRGEEAQVFGAIALRPDFRHGTQTLVLPGTHSKWVALEDGAITGLRTFLSGELFALLGKSSLLPGGAVHLDDAESEGFGPGVLKAREGLGLLGSLFSARVSQVRGGRSAGWARGYLSGLVIGSELAETAAIGALPESACLIGDPQLTALYAKAFAFFGVAASVLDGEACVLEGLKLLDAHD